MLLNSADTASPVAGSGCTRSARLGLFNGLNRRHVAVVLRTDGRLVQVPAEDLGLVDVSLLGVLRSLELGIERVFAIITGSRREPGRRDRRS